MSDKKRPIFVRNRKRELRDALGRNERWVPEHERLNMTPISAVDKSEDFMNEQKRKRPMGSRKPPAPVGRPARKRTKAVASGQAQGQSWLPHTGQAPSRVPEKDYSHGHVPYDDVPDIPENRFKHTHAPLDPGVDLSDVPTGSYCLLYDGEKYISESLDEIEGAVEHIMRSDHNVDESELVVVHRLGIRVGAHIGR